MTRDDTLYERLGGREAIGAVVDEFYDRMVADDRVAHHFSETDMVAQRAHQTQFLSAVTGGPVDYEGGDMETVHEGMGISEAEFDALGEHLDAALREFDVPASEREAVLDAVEGYRQAVVETETETESGSRGEA